MPRLRLGLALLVICAITSGRQVCYGKEEAAPEAVLASGPPKEFRKGAEKLQFQAEVNRMLDILINSLYSNKDIFLRELISNAADALDKIRFLSISNASELDSGSELGIKIWADPERRILSVRDTGVGMTRDELVSNLGTVARSGTSAFLEQLQKGGDLSLIGQFGVGFYSVYLVADYVEVVTKHNNGSQLVWESRADGEYAISSDEEGGESQGRGTQINLHLKPDCEEYLQPAKLRELVERYSEFIPFPISLRVEKEVEVEEEEQIDDDVEDEEEKKKTETSVVWETLNEAQPLWLRPASDVAEEEYAKFYKTLTKQEQESPVAQAHFRAEGDVEFRALVYVPGSAPPGFYNEYQTAKPRVKLYVRRVLISDAPEGLLPRWLGWLVGVVDSDDMPLNVNRETLQLHQGLKVIRKKLVRKALDMLRRLSDEALEAGRKLKEESSTTGDEGTAAPTITAEERIKLESSIAKYASLWREFGKAIKMGVIEEKQQRKRMTPLLRFQSSNGLTGSEELTSLDEYVSRMKPGQERIYFVTGLSLAEAKGSPFATALTRRGYEVLYLTDPLDEYLTSHVTEHDGHELVNASKEDLKLPEDAEDKEREEQVKKEFKALTRWWKRLLTPSQPIESVRVSRRVAHADAGPCLVAANKFGWTAQMERIATAQALGGEGAESVRWQRGLRVLELNPEHALVRELRERVEQEPDSPETKNRALLLYETCLLDSGYTLEDVGAFNDRVRHLLGSALGLKGIQEPPPPASKLDDKAKKEEEEETLDVSVEQDDDVKDEL